MGYLRLWFFFLIINTAATSNVMAQAAGLPGLKQKLRLLKQKIDFTRDTAYINTINQIAFVYADSYPDSAFEILKEIPGQSAAIGYYHGEINSYKILGNALQTKGEFDKALQYYERAYLIADDKNYKDALPALLGNIALVHYNKGNYPVALQKFYAALKAAEATGDKLVVRSSLNNIGTIHFYQGKMDEAEQAYQKTLVLSRALADTAGVILAYNNLGETSLEKNDPTKALGHLSKAYNLALASNVPDMLVAVTNTLGDTYYRLDSTNQAMVYFKSALSLANNQSNARASCKALIGLAKVQNKMGLHDKALVNALEALRKADDMGQAQLLRDAYEIVASVYENMGEGNSAIKYFKNYKLYADSLVSIESERAAANYKAGYEFSKRELAFERKSAQQLWLIFSACAALLVLLFILWLIVRNRKRLSRTYVDLQHKNEVIEEQKRKAEETLDQLKATQRQLVQSEKMASLGELTAGIAHEIQNPLNFVNNFSEVSKELIDEMNDQINIGDFEEAKIIAVDIKQNLEKINHHGKRAGDIVKGMLQHSRGGSDSTKELVDINKLTDEYFRLAYHGLRAKDKSFNATLKTDFDKRLSAGEAGKNKVNIIPQNIGRIILNVITNAFYAVDQKKKENIEGYEPTVLVSTKKISDKLQISVKDNGNGIPQKNIDKIFQPFFTTKPTGQGTGLGLSMSYDIVKAHGGELTVETKEGEGSEFIIELPVV